MPDYNIDEDLLQDIESESGSAWEQYGTEGSYGDQWYNSSFNPSAIDTEGLSNEQMAYMSTDPQYMAAMMTDLGISNADDYTKFINAYDPFKEDLAHKKFQLGKDKLMSDTREGLMGKLGDPLASANMQSKSGFEGMGQAQGGYLKSLENLDIKGAENRFSQGLQGASLGRDEAIAGAQEDWSNQFYRDVGDIYSQQQSGGGGKK